MAEAAISKVPIQLHVEDAGHKPTLKFLKWQFRQACHFPRPSGIMLLQMSFDFTHGLACTVSVGRECGGLVSTYANASAS